eukprot:15480331-Alexandrium_andersonii.AAC.2
MNRLPFTRLANGEEPFIEGACETFVGCPGAPVWSSQSSRGPPTEEPAQSWAARRGCCWPGLLPSALD